MYPMITPEPRIMSHFTHAHVLTEYNGTGEFTCNGCNKYGSSGTAYRCVDCNYYLHEYCATCPLTLRTFLHPPHDLRLVFMRNIEPRVCHVCDKPVDGLFYQCQSPCQFRAHPLCTKLPQFVRHVALHPDHPLELFHTTIAGACFVCGGVCISWRYSCFACGLHVHMKCLAVTEKMKQRSMQEQGVDHFNYGNPPQNHAGNGSFSGHHRRVNSCGPILEGGNNADGETPRKNKNKNKNKALKFASRFGLIAAQAMGLPGLDLLVDSIGGGGSSDDSSDP